jgi:hypothetical protein
MRYGQGERSQADTLRVKVRGSAAESQELVGWYPATPRGQSLILKNGLVTMAGGFATLPGRLTRPNGYCTCSHMLPPVLARHRGMFLRNHSS